MQNLLLKKRQERKKTKAKDSYMHMDDVNKKIEDFEKALQQLSIDDADNLLEEVENMLLDLDKYVTNQVNQVSQHINNIPSGSIDTQNK
jgi:hypothetical protein